MSLRFEFATAVRIVFGAGRVREIGTLAREFGRRALLVTGRHAGRAEPVIKLLSTEGIAASAFAVGTEPNLESVTKGVAQAREAGCDFVVSLGGGSAIDCGKAIAAMLTNPGELLDYLEVIGKGQALVRPAAPFVAIPTTAGTGSEVTRNAVLASPEHRVKVSLRSPLMLARLALIDPELTYSLPPAVTASTGLDALTQLIEPYVCSRSNPLTDALCVEGIQRVARSLREASLDGTNAGAREDMCVASLFGGLALANAGLGAVHGFAGPIGGMFAAPHGEVCAALLPHVMDINLRALRQRQPDGELVSRFQTLARFLTRNPAATADDGVEWVRCLTRDLKIPSLSSFGINAVAIDELIHKSAQASSMKANPIPLTREELKEILQRSL